MSGDKSKTTILIVARYAVSCMRDDPADDVGDSSSHEDRQRQGAADDTNEETVEDTVNVTLTVNINVEWHDGSRYKMTDDHLAEWEDFFQEAEK